jgi:mono/diheme cytochrome c family protein
VDWRWRSPGRSSGGPQFMPQFKENPHCMDQQPQQKMHMKKLLAIGLTVFVASAVSALAGDAKANYESNCAKCHGADGKGQTKMGQKLGVKDYTDAKVQAELKDDVAFKSIKEGLKDADGKTLMKPVEGLSDDDIKALVAYMRTFKK